MQNDNIEKASKSWSESLDKDVFQAVDNLDDYDPEIRHIILEEAERRKKDLPLEKPILTGQDDKQLPESISGEPIYFAVSPLKLVVMSICTVGTYELYWFYKNWVLIKEREDADIMPFWRAFFGYFFCYSCFLRIQGTGKSLNLGKSIAPLALALLWITVWLLYLLPGLYCFLSSFSVLVLLPVQAVANNINEALCPEHNPNRRFTGWNIACIVVGATCLVILLWNSESIPRGTGF